MIGFYNYTVIATYLSLASGVVGILCAAAHHPVIAVFCLMFSGLLDAFDGRIARTKKDRTVREERFGVQIDSFSDLVAFGVLPVMIGYSSATYYEPMGFKSPMFYIYAAAGALYVLGGLIRLSFYNIGEEESREHPTKPARKTYTGLPITTSALIFPVVYLLVYLFNKHTELIFTIIWTLVMLAVGFCFVGRFHIRKPTNKQIIMIIALGVVIAVIVGVVHAING